MFARRCTSYGLVLGLGAFACSPTPAPTPDTVDTSADIEAIRQVRTREITAFSAGQTDSLLAVISEDVVLMPPNEPALNGAAAVRTWTDNFAAQVTVRGEYTSFNATVVGDWAIERYTGTLAITPKAGGKTITEQIKGIHIYRRQADGSWRIVQDVWNTDAPTPPAQ